MNIKFSGVKLLGGFIYLTNTVHVTWTLLLALWWGLGIGTGRQKEVDTSSLWLPNAGVLSNLSPVVILNSERFSNSLHRLMAAGAVVAVN